MESDHFKTFSIVFGSISFVISISGYPTLYSLGQFIACPKLTPEKINEKLHSDRYVCVTGISQSKDSFLNRTDKQGKVIYSRLKTKFDFLGLSSRNLYNKSVQYSTFEIVSNDQPVNVIPAYHTKVHAPMIYEKYNTDLSGAESTFYKMLGFFFSPFIPILGLSIKLGETVTEKALKDMTFTSVAGRLRSDNGKFSIVPDYISQNSGQIYTYLLKKSALILLGTLLFGGLSLFCKYKSAKRQKELQESQRSIQGSKDLKCLQCGDQCDQYFKPCFEIVLCQKCSSSVSECPKCHKSISDKVAFHIS